jgi:hypothetical protein
LLLLLLRAPTPPGEQGFNKIEPSLYVAPLFFKKYIVFVISALVRRPQLSPSVALHFVINRTYQTLNSQQP